MLKYFVYEEGKTTKENTDMDELLAYFDSRRNSSDKGSYLSFGFSTDDISPKSGHCMDILGCKDDNLFRINDYKNIDSSDKSYKEINEAVDLLCEKCNVSLQFTTDKLLAGISGCLIPIENENAAFTYMDDKIPLLDSKMNLKSCINEVFVESRGYVPYKEFVYENSFNNAVKFPVIKMVNVRYVNLSGGIGQADLLPEEYLKFVKKYSKEYKLAMDVVEKHACGYVCMFYTFASFDSKQEAVKRSFELGIPYLKGESDVFVVDSKGNIIFKNELTEGDLSKAEDNFGVDFSKRSEPFSNGLLYAENLDDFYEHHDYYAGKIENEVPDGPYNEHFAPVKGKSR